jgi:hypothetical protein
MTTTVPTGHSPEVQVTVLGDLSPATTELARATLQDLLAEVRQPVRSAQVRLTRMWQKADRPAVAQALVDVDGRLVRAQVATHTMTETIALLRARLAVQLARLEWASQGHTAADSEGTGPQEWREGTEPIQRPVRLLLPKGERSISRRKQFPLARQTVDQAAFVMETMDYDFHLFTESGSGQDSVIYRFGPGPFRLAQVDPHPDELDPVSVAVHVLKAPAPVLTPEEAKERLDASEHPFVFFTDSTTGRGSILYGRYDGHYGLITPAEAAEAAEGAAGAPTAAGATRTPAAVPGRPRDLEGTIERVEVLEAQVQALAEALLDLVHGLEETPGGPADPQRVQRSVRQAHDLLLTQGLASIGKALPPAPPSAA